MNEENDDRFYMTYARSRPSTLVPWIEDNNVPLLTNAVHRWSDAREALLSMWEYDTPHVIDAGGYNVQRSWVADYGSVRGPMSQSDARDATRENPEALSDTLSEDAPFYPWTVSEYHEWLSEYADEFVWATAMDYACEEKFDPLWSVADRRDATFENTLEHFNYDPEYKVLPVLQGRSVDEYVDFYDRLADHGIPTDHVGLGTVCRLSSEKEIVRVEQAIRERTNVERIHGFGVKIEAFKHGATFQSADSQAWVYGPSNGRCMIDDGDRLGEVQMPDNSLARTVESFKNYYSYVTRLQQGESVIDYDSGITDGDAVDVQRKHIAQKYEN